MCADGTPSRLNESRAVETALPCATCHRSIEQRDKHFIRYGQTRGRKPDPRARTFH